MRTDFTQFENPSFHGARELAILSQLEFRPELGLARMIGHLIFWVILSMFTLGFALMLFPYYIMRFVLNNTYVYDQREGKKIGRLQCDIELAGIFANAFIWFLLTIITLGLAYFFFIYRIKVFCYSRTKIVSL
ncbi:MAG: hypothetical protein Q4G44_06630 [Alcaligenaceae bacterium]|nr:hypothetical protein [Alcaligenaceae bacterium]